MQFLMLSCFVPQKSPISSTAKTEKQALLVLTLKKNQVEKIPKYEVLVFYSQISAKHQTGLEI